MLDTNIFNLIVEDIILLPNIKGFRYYSTEVQYKEILGTKDNNRRDILLRSFIMINPEIIDSETALWGEFLWGRRNFGYATNDYTLIKQNLDNLEKKKNNKQDALIAEVAIKCNFILITNDSNFRIALSYINKQALSFEEFLRISNI